MIVSRKSSVQTITALLAAFVAVVLLAAMPSPAAALSWSFPATDLSGPETYIESPQVAVAGDGVTTVVWSRWDRYNGGDWIVQARTRPAGSDTFGAAVDLSAPGQNAHSPQVAVAADGATTVVWTRNNGSNSIVQARTRPAGSGTFGGVVDLSATGQDAESLQVAVAGDGATTVVWSRSNGSNVTYIVQVRTRPAGSSTFGGVVDLGNTSFDSPQVTVGVDGAITVVWTRYGGSNDKRIQARTRPAGSSTFGAVEYLTALGQDAGSPQVAVGVDGATTVVWYRFDGSRNIVQARTRPAGSSTFGGAENLSATGQDAGSPQVAVAADGATTVVWYRYGGSNWIVQARTRPAGSGTFGGAENLAAAGDNNNGLYPQVTVGAGGATTVVWGLRNGFSSYIVQARTRPAGSSTFGGAVDLGNSVNSPQVTVGVDGAVTVVWIGRYLGPGSRYTIQESTSVIGSTKYSLTLTKPNMGSGSISSSPSGIDCGLVCSYRFNPSTSVTLTASPASGSTFDGWGGSGCSGTSTCTVTMLGARSVWAEFAVVPLVPPASFDLTVSKSGTGSGTITSSPDGIDCGSDCLESLENGSLVTLTAKPETGSSFIGWSGPDGCWDTSPCEVTMDEARDIDAEFTKSKLPSNSFTIRSVKVGVKALTSTVVLPGRGTLTQIVRRSVKKKSKSVKITVCKTSKKVTKAGTVKLTCKLSSATRKARVKRSLRVRMKTTFTPTGGLKASKTKTIKLKRRR